MGLLLRPDTYYTSSDDALYLLTYDGPVVVGGGSAHPLLTRLAPHLDGSRSLDELTAGLTGPRRDMVRQLVTVLLDKGAITQHDLERRPGPAGGYRNEASFLDHFANARTFHDYRAEPAVVVGQGHLVPAAVAAALCSGLADVRVVTGEPEAGPGWAARGRRDPGQRLRHLPWDDGTAAALDGAGLVLHVGDRPEPDRARRLERLCASAGIDLFQAFLLDGAVWSLSSGPRAGDGPGWSSLARRHAGRFGGTGEAAPDSPALDVAAAQLVHQAFRTVTGAARPAPGGIARLDGTTLRREPHAALPHPFERPAETPTVAAFQARTRALRTSPPLTPETFSQRAARCADDALGIFGRPEEGALAQLPLHVCEVETSDPVGLLGPRDVPPRVFGTGLDFASARLAAALNAFSAYGSLMVDPRRLVGPDHEQAFPGDADPDQALSRLREDAHDRFVHGYALTDGRVRLVRASLAFPVLNPTARHLPVPPGVASAYTWRDAVTAGVLAHVGRLTLEEMTAEARPRPRIDLDTAPLDRAGARYRAILAAVDEEVVVHDVTGTLSVPTVFCDVGRKAGSCASGLSLTDALRAALAEAVLGYQSRLHGQPSYAPPPVPEPPPSCASAPAPAAVDLQTVAAALSAHGHEPVAVPLDHDPEVSAVMPNTVHVVVADG
ncbi:YcaO-like family protein [Actinomadura oligospora]|uniref:YcaO-like family protein n=1 Tax=Actinomadura oligospora TaxID=111804 RepID=UPI00047CFBA7|nr:YcaO-like family protein [Actinomadura oligospora]